MTDHTPQLLDLRSIFGLEARVTAPAAATGGAYVEMDCLLEPDGKSEIHYHPEQEEFFEVTEGTLELLRDGTWHTVSAGETFVVPTAAVHGFRNTSGGQVRFRNRHSPALRFQEHLETVDRLIREGKFKGFKDPRSAMYMCQSVIEHNPSISVRPPHWVVRLMAFLGRRLGYTLDGPTPTRKPHDVG